MTHSGHRVAYRTGRCMLAFDQLLPGGAAHAAARVHQGSCWLGRCFAVCSSRTTARAHAVHRRAASCECGRCRISDVGWRVPARITASRLEHWPKRARIDTHWATSDATGIRKHAAVLAALAPDAPPVL